MRNLYTDYMLCPNCSEPMKSSLYSNQEVLHCSNCGGSFFQENSVNRVSSTDASKLAKDSKINIVHGEPKICPKDSLFLHLVSNDEAVPKSICLYRCPRCNGIFAYADDLVKFKKAQNAKINFFKAWGNPLPALRTVLVLSMLAVLSFSILNTLTSKSVTSTQAEDVIKGIAFTKTGRYLFVNFKTEQAFSSYILLRDKKTNVLTTYTISEVPTKLHYVTITDVDSTHTFRYQVVLKNAEGTEFVTDEKPAVFK